MVLANRTQCQNHPQKALIRTVPSWDIEKDGCTLTAETESSGKPTGALLPSAASAPLSIWTTGVFRSFRNFLFGNGNISEAFNDFPVQHHVKPFTVLVANVTFATSIVNGLNKLLSLQSKPDAPAE